MPFMANMVWPGRTQKSTTKDYNILPQMPSKFVERAFLVGGFVGSKSQAGSSPSSRTQITLNDVIFEQLLQHGLDLYTNIIKRANCDRTNNKMVSEKVPLENYNSNNWRSNMNSNCVNNCSSEYFKQFSSNKHRPHYANNSKSTSMQVPLTKHCQEELVYEDKDEGGNSIYVYQEVQKSTCEVTKTSMFHIRSRTISDCSIESDDSFIIFESSDENEEKNDCGGDCSSIEDDDEDDDDPDTFQNYEVDYSSSDESNEFEEVDGLVPAPECHTLPDTSRIKDANSKWNRNYDNISHVKSSKKVSFANGKDLVKTRTMVTWNFAHRAARKGPWEILALDTCRFKAKIQQLANIISPVLEFSHRMKIYEQRCLHTSSPPSPPHNIYLKQVKLN